jgi:hypothetical protein
MHAIIELFAGKRRAEVEAVIELNAALLAWSNCILFIISRCHTGALSRWLVV